MRPRPAKPTPVDRPPMSAATMHMHPAGERASVCRAEFQFTRVFRTTDMRIEVIIILINKTMNKPTPHQPHSQTG